MYENSDRNNRSGSDSENNISIENSKDKKNPALKHLENKVNTSLYNTLDSLINYSCGKTNNSSVVNSLASGITDIGKVRQNNEDSFYHDAKNGLFIVADGMGGHNGGEEASKTAIQTVLNFLTEHINHLDISHKSQATYLQSQKNTHTITNKKKIDYIMHAKLH